MALCRRKSPSSYETSASLAESSRPPLKKVEISHSAVRLQVKIKHLDWTSSLVKLQENDIRGRVGSQLISVDGVRLSSSKKECLVISMPSMHRQVEANPVLLDDLKEKTVIVTGGAAGIGAATIRLCNSKGANVVVADLEHTRAAAYAAIASLPHPGKAMFVGVNILDWRRMKQMFDDANKRFGRIDIVVANAGKMESAMVLDLDDTEADGSAKEPMEAYNVIDINLKGTLNTLKLAMHYMNKTASPARPGSVILIASPSGYFGSTGVSAYVASKHGVVGLLRASQVEARKRGNIRVNGVAPGFTPTAITAEYSQRWKDTGMEANTVEDVAAVIAQTAVDTTLNGACVLVASRYRRELEQTRAAFAKDWIGHDLAALLSSSTEFFEAIGGYPLPKI